MNGTPQSLITELPRLTQEKYENIFRVYQDNDQYFYNMLRTIDIPKNLPSYCFQTYDVGYGETWPVISHKIYNTTHLYWLILEANNIVDPTQQPVPGTKIKAFTKVVASEILTNIARDGN